MATAVLVRRQSPAWEQLSRDFRAGLEIDPRRYLPDHAIRGFPAQLEALIGKWNATFAIDFFTFRAVLAEASGASAAAVRGAQRVAYEQLGVAARLAAAGAHYFYFHDDDDFLAPRLGEMIAALEAQPDAVVTPMFKIAQRTVTLVRPGCEPALVLGERKVQPFRYQTNNYGVHSRRCQSLDDLVALKDHAVASQRAEEAGYADLLLPEVVSATVKTPASASMLPRVLAVGGAGRDAFEAFVSRAAGLDLPPGYDWFAGPLRIVTGLVEATMRGERPRALAGLLAAGLRPFRPAWL
ncbi:MAG TPA: hypothetical protein VGS12_18615 [Caulobacteraceae bacterium]|nr:hypothetical protein [Caulobacteraceae bacterium]